MKNKFFTPVATSLVCLIPLLAGLAIYDQLPDIMATHFDFEGNANGYSSKNTVVFGIPAFMLLMNLFVQFAISADPKNSVNSPAMKAVACWSLPVILTVVQLSILGEALGYKVNIQLGVGVMLGALFVIIGNYLPKCKHNFTMGIRLPWTLNSEENWSRTHRLAGPIWVISGILIAVSSFFGGFNWVIFAAVMVAMCGIPFVYSYRLYKKGI